MPGKSTRRLGMLGAMLMAGCDSDYVGENGNNGFVATKPCELPGTQFTAKLQPGSGVNAVTGPYNGDVLFIGGDVFSFQQASVQRKFLIHIPNLNPAVYYLSTTYMSYTEKTGDADPNPKVWKGTSGILKIESCPGGGVAVTTADAPDRPASAAYFSPVPASSNQATGDMLIQVSAHF